MQLRGKASVLLLCRQVETAVLIAPDLVWLASLLLAFFVAACRLRLLCLAFLSHCQQ
jgi:hypothetical protein